MDDEDVPLPIKVCAICGREWVDYDSSPFINCSNCRKPAPKRKKTMKFRGLKDSKRGDPSPWNENAVRELEDRYE